MPALFEVDPEEIRTVLALAIPAHPDTTFDEAVMIDLIAHSYSVTIAEKIEMVGSIGKWTQFQVDSLIQILINEKRAFEQLNAKHAARLAARTAGEDKESAVRGIDAMFDSPARRAE